MAERRSTDAEHGFDEVFETCWLSTFRFALAWTNDWPAAEDIAQEAFARLWTKRESVDCQRANVSPTTRARCRRIVR